MDMAGPTRRQTLQFVDEPRQVVGRLRTSFEASGTGFDLHKTALVGWVVTAMMAVSAVATVMTSASAQCLSFARRSSTATPLRLAVSASEIMPLMRETRQRPRRDESHQQSTSHDQRHGVPEHELDFSRCIGGAAPPRPSLVILSTDVLELRSNFSLSSPWRDARVSARFHRQWPRWLVRGRTR